MSKLSDLAQVLLALSLKEVEMAVTQEELLVIRKRWMKYFANLNKYLAGATDVIPTIG